MRISRGLKAFARVIVDNTTGRADVQRYRDDLDTPHGLTLYTSDIPRCRDIADIPQAERAGRKGQPPGE